MKRRLRYVSYILLSALTILAIGEVAVRYLQTSIPDRADMPFRRDDDCGYTLTPTPPGLYAQSDDRHVNSLGFRDREHLPGKTPGVRRVLGMGDSFVYGNVPIADNFLRLLEDSLGVEACIAGLPGWDVRNATGFMRGAGARLEPDLVVLCFSIGSDITGIPLPGRVYQGNLYFTDSLDPRRNILRKSRLFVVLKQLHYRRWRRKVRNLQSGQDAGSRTALREQHGLPPGAPYFPGLFGEPLAIAKRTPADPGFLARQADNLILFDRQPPARLETWWEDAQAQLLDFDQACREAGCPWLLLAAPAEIQADPVVQKAVLTFAKADADDYDFELPNRRLEAFARDNGLAYLDPLPRIRTAMQDSELRHYIPNNGHWNVPGNRLLASVLSAYIWLCP